MKTTIDGIEIEYDVRGEGPAVLLLHAFPLGLFTWDAQAEALSSTHRVVRFDARGFGGSAPGKGPLAMERIADDGASLLDHLGIGTAVVGGCSMGGYAAFAFVRRHPQRLAGLVLDEGFEYLGERYATGSRGARAIAGTTSPSSTATASPTLISGMI